MAIAVNDHRIQILSGYGLEGMMPDVVLSRIIRNQHHTLFQAKLSMLKGLKLA